MSALMDVNEPWMAAGNCTGLKPSIFLPDEEEHPDLTEKELYAFPRTVCATCPIQKQCLEYALTNEIPFGMWGGTTPSERRSIRRQRNRAKGRRT